MGLRLPEFTIQTPQPKATLIIFSGLPGTGKTTIAKALASALGAVYLRADAIEQAMRDWGFTDNQIGGAGYMVGYALATENLTLGLSVVADTVNPWELTRDEWRNAAIAASCPYLDVEVICSDLVEHRRRVESREPDIAGHLLPTWQDVVERDYHAFVNDRLVIDTAVVGTDEAVGLIKSRLESV